MAEQIIPNCYCDVIHNECSVCKTNYLLEKSASEGRAGINIYRHTFAAFCPADGEMIVYRIELKSLTMIHVEHIRAATALIKKGWHEEIADRLSESLGGDQKIVATHQGIEIETVRLSG